ncbi:MAG: 3-oxoacyl-[acyl-carrier-protein] synthase III C-terminal domain-containing protein [Pseudomonadota bacterium]
MRIVSIAHGLPETELSNSEAINLFREECAENVTEEDWEEIERRISFYINMSGINGRRLAPRNSNVMELAFAAARDAVDKAGVEPEDIDLVIYASVSRGWLEPNTAVTIQNYLGATNATSFDILDACAGWVRAMHVVHSMLKAGTYRNALIVNLEAGMLDFIRFGLERPEEIKDYGAGITLGNAATAMFVQQSDGDDFYFNIKTFPESTDLCMIPLDNVRNFYPTTEDSKTPLAGKFIAKSTPLLKKTISNMIEVFNSDKNLVGRMFDIVFTHAVVERAFKEISAGTKVPLESHYSTLGKYGNTASATVPLAMSLALEEGKLKRGQQVGIAVGSAGITVAFATFTF